MLVDQSILKAKVFKCFLAVLLIFLTTCIGQVRGRKCVCTSKACKEGGVDMCKTKYSCYTEFILSEGQDEYATTRGCMEGATPLSCETKSWVRRRKSNNKKDITPASSMQMPWPSLECCNSHDYCNADHHMNISTWIRENQRADPTEPATDYMGTDAGVSSNRIAMESIESDRKPTAGGRGSLNLLRRRVRPLHFATLALAISALISVLAACYVITRFLKSNSYTADAV